jgi:hypothetical protein
METALVLRGGQGVGKTKVGEVVGSLLGDHYTLVSSPRYVVGQFNAHMRALLLLHADEAFWAGDKAAEGKLKDLVTGRSHFIEYKGVDPIEVKNYVRLFVTGNHDWQIPAGFGERRFAVFDVGEAHKEDHAYFAAIDAEMDNGGREALLHYLLTFDLPSVNLRKIPETAALLEQKIASMTPDEAWWFDILRKGRLPPQINNQPGTCLRDVLFDTYMAHAQRQGARNRSVDTKIGIFLGKFVPGLASSKTTVSGKREWVYSFPPLRDCREAYAQAMRSAVNWGEDWEDDEWQHVEPLPF